MPCPPKCASTSLPLHAEYDAVRAAEAAARPRHVDDCLQFAAQAWRRPLTEKEKQSLRSFYDQDHHHRTGSRQGDPRAARAHPGLARVPVPRGAAGRTAAAAQAAHQTGKWRAA